MYIVHIPKAGCELGVCYAADVLHRIPKSCFESADWIFEFDDNVRQFIKNEVKLPELSDDQLDNLLMIADAFE